ncbi:MAG: YeeE/YedE thiosulfate transporter family protein [Clostridiaceae bacterium]
MKNQLPYGLALLVILLSIGIFQYSISPLACFFWISGIVFGFILQRSRFCFTASMRDLYLTRRATVFKAVLAALALTTIGITAIKYGYFLNGLPVPGQSYIVPVSLSTAIGGFLFGIGMVIAGGCASGTLMRVGDGHLLQIITLTFFIIGSAWGAHDYSFWERNFISKAKAIFLPDLFGWLGALIIQLLLLIALYRLAVYWEKRGDTD